MSAVTHVVLFRLLPGVSAVAVTSARATALGMQGKIDGVERVEFGETFSTDRSRGFTHMLVVRLSSRAALEGYGPHPAHQALVAALQHHLDVNDERGAGTKPVLAMDIES